MQAEPPAIDQPVEKRAREQRELGIVDREPREPGVDAKRLPGSIDVFDRIERAACELERSVRRMIARASEAGKLGEKRVLDVRHRAAADRQRHDLARRLIARAQTEIWIQALEMLPHGRPPVACAALSAEVDLGCAANDALR